MPDIDRDLMARLDALGAHAEGATPPMPAGLTEAVAAQGVAGHAVARQRMPSAAMSVAAAVVAVGAAVVMLKAPVLVRPAPTGINGAATLAAMTERFNRIGSIDSVLESFAVRGSTGSAAEGVPVYRAIDARTGQVPE